MKKILDQQLFLTIKDFFADQADQGVSEPNDLARFLSEIKSQEVFLNEQGVYEESEFLECIDYNFEKTGLYSMFSSSRQEAKKLIQEIFSNQTKFSSDNVEEIEKHIRKYYKERNTDTLMRMGSHILDEEEFTKENFPNASSYILELSSKVEAHKIKEGLGVIYSVVLKDEEKLGQKAIHQGKKEFFNFINECLIGNDEPIFYYNESKNDVDVNLCSHRSVFDAFLRNKNGAYSVLIATNSHDSKVENETAFTQPISALHIVNSIEKNILPLKDKDYSSIENLIALKEAQNENRVYVIKETVSNLMSEYARVKHDKEVNAKLSGAPKGQILVDRENNDTLELLIDDMVFADKPGPKMNPDAHINKKGKKALLSREATVRYIEKLETLIRENGLEQEKLLEENENRDLLVKNNFVDYTSDDTNQFISNNLRLLKHFIPNALKRNTDEPKSFRSLVHLLDNNTDVLIKDLGLSPEKDDYGNLILKENDVKELVNKFEENNLTIRFYGKNQGKNNHAYLSVENQEKVSKEAVCYVMGQYTYLDYLLYGKNGVKMDFEGGCSYIENVLLKNTITETSVKGKNKKEQQVIYHQKINDPEYTKDILKTILNDYVFKANKDDVLQIYDKNNKEDKNLDNITLGYISSTIEAFWSDFSSKINNTMTTKDINRIYFESCGNLGIKVEKSFEDVLKTQIEINNSSKNNKARNPTIIAELKSIQEVFERVKLNDFIVDKEKKEVEKMIKMGIPKESIQELKPDFDFSLIEQEGESKKARQKAR